MSDITKIAELVTSEVFKDLGLTVTLEQVSLADLANYRSLGKFKINPSMCGPVGIMFSSIDVEVHVGAYRCNGLIACFQYEFSYNHPHGGSNGKTIRKEIEVAE